MPLLLPLDEESDAPLHRLIYERIRDAILDGSLPAGTRLPSTRILAADLGVSRNTVVAAFEQLRVEGHTTSRRGGGTRVRGAAPRTSSERSTSVTGAGRPQGEAAPSRAAATGGAKGAVARLPGDRISERGRVLEALEGDWLMRSRLGPVPFQLGIPDLDVFPSRVWARLVARRWRRGTVHLGHGHAAGHPVLREAIAAYVSNARAARCDAEQVLVVNGAQQALHLAAHVLLDPGDAAWVEEPGYFGARLALSEAGARIVPVPVDEEGLVVAAGERTEPNARLAYVTPSHQFPLGVVMSAPRRLALLAWARRTGAWVLEDDYDSEFRYEGRPLPSLQGMEPKPAEGSDSSRVLYIGTFSKTVAPGLRLGYLIVPDALVAPLGAARIAADLHTPTFEQGVLADFIGDGHYARHLRRVRALYAERQAALLRAAEAELGELLSMAPDPAGLHLVGWLPEGASAARAADEANAAGVATQPLSVPVSTREHPGGSGPSTREGLLLGYAGYDETRIGAAAAELASALRRALRTGSRRGRPPPVR